MTIFSVFSRSVSFMMLLVFIVLLQPVDSWKITGELLFFSFIAGFAWEMANDIREAPHQETIKQDTGDDEELRPF